MLLLVCSFSLNSTLLSYENQLQTWYSHYLLKYVVFLYFNQRLSFCTTASGWCQTNSLLQWNNTYVILPNSITIPLMSLLQLLLIQLEILLAYVVNCLLSRHIYPAFGFSLLFVYPAFHWIYSEFFVPVPQM